MSFEQTRRTMERHMGWTTSASGDVRCTCGTVVLEHRIAPDGIVHVISPSINDLYVTHLSSVIEEIAIEREARAWDKGYGRGREDGSSWDVLIAGVRDKSSRNPYRWWGDADQT